MAACDKVLNISELRESILSFLPPRQVLKAERVCKGWKEVIESSTQITRLHKVTASRTLQFPHMNETAPVFPIGTDIRINPALAPLSPIVKYDRPRRMKLLYYCFKTEPWPLAAHPKLSAHEYLTSPPVCSLGISMFWPWGKGKVISPEPDRLLESDEGVRMQDLDAAVAEAMSKKPGWDMPAVKVWCCEEVGILEHSE